MRISIIGIAGLPARYGGFETLAENLVKHLGDRFDFTVYCSSFLYRDRPQVYNGASLIYLPLRANGIMSIFYDIVAIFHALKHADLLLILGVSGTVILPVVRVLTRKSVVVHIDGIEWKRQKWNLIARAYLKLSEAIAVRFATRVISDNEVIQGYVKERYGKDSVLIEYGGDHASYADREDYLGEFPFMRERYALSVCRVEPENNVHIILDAFSRIREFPLVIIGNWHGNKYGRQLLKKYLTFKHIHLIDAIFDQRKLDALRSNCNLYIHGHSAGGTNPSLVEAMSLGLPVIAFDVSFNRATTEDRAIYFRDRDDLMRIIKGFTDSERQKISFHMKEIALRRYTWQTTSAKYSNLFEKSITTS